MNESDKWMLLRLTSLGFYCSSWHDNLEEAILVIFETAEASPNEFTESYKGIKDCALKYGALSHTPDLEGDPLWMLAHESKSDSVIARLLEIVLGEI